MRGGAANVAAAMLGFTGCLCAQSLPGSPLSDANLAPAFRILKGELLAWNVRGLSGDLIMETDDGASRWRCQVTMETFLSRGTIRIHPAGVRVGDTLEIVAEGAPTSCVARTVYVKAPDLRRFQTRIRVSGGQLDSLWPRGLLTFSGIVNRVENDRLYLQTRKFGAKSFALRDDTMFSDGGRPVDLAALGTQTRVFVRANRTFEGDLEVYQVIWGKILQTREGH